MEKIYLHAINANSRSYISVNTRNILKSILQDGSLLSLRLQRKFELGFSFSGMDFVSLCDYDRREIVSNEDETYNSFNGYIRNSLSLAFDKENLDVITPNIVAVSNRSYGGYLNMQRLGNYNTTNTRYSDMPDEVQVRDRVSLEEMVAVTFPTHLLVHTFQNDQTNADMVMYEVGAIESLLRRYKHDVPIYDIDTFKDLRINDNAYDICKNIKQLKKRR